MSKLIVTELTCKFELQNYPFDNQECLVILVNTESNHDIVQLISSPTVAYNGGPNSNFLNYVIETPEVIKKSNTTNGIH